MAETQCSIVVVLDVCSSAALKPVDGHSSQDGGQRQKHPPNVTRDESSAGASAETVHNAASGCPSGSRFTLVTNPSQSCGRCSGWHQSACQELIFVNHPEHRISYANVKRVNTVLDHGNILHTQGDMVRNISNNEHLTNMYLEETRPYAQIILTILSSVFNVEKMST